MVWIFFLCETVSNCNRWEVIFYLRIDNSNKGDNCNHSHANSKPFDKGILLYTPERFNFLESEHTFLLFQLEMLLVSTEYLVQPEASKKVGEDK